MDSVVTAGAGFLLAVLWFDFMFDVQVRGHSGDVLPESVLASIAAYYRRVTTDARPMNRLMAAAMLATLVALIAQLVGDDAPRWVSTVSVLLAVAAIGLAARRTVPSAVRLGARREPLAMQRMLARSIARDHLFCLTCISLLLLVQLIWA